MGVRGSCPVWGWNNQPTRICLLRGKGKLWGIAHYSCPGEASGMEIVREIVSGQERRVEFQQEACWAQNGRVLVAHNRYGRQECCQINSAPNLKGIREVPIAPKNL